jgi:hypothetical protein
MSKFSVRLPQATAKQCFVLGNGPSLKTSIEENSDFLCSSELVCVNNFASTFAYEQLKPQNYVILDPAYYIAQQEDARADIKDTIEALCKKTNWDVTIFVTQQARKAHYLNDLPKRNPHIKIIYFNYTIFRSFKTIQHWFYRHNLGMPQSENVLVTCIYLMLNRGFKEIYLFGADHSWHEQLQISDDNVMMRRDEHFYDTKPANYQPVIDFVKQRSVPIYYQFQSLAKAFYGYEVLRDYAQSLGATVYNASIKSYIDAFQRIKI